MKVLYYARDMQVQFTLSHKSCLGDFETMALSSQPYVAHRIAVMIGKIGGKMQWAVSCSWRKKHL